MFGPEYFIVKAYRSPGDSGEWYGDIICRKCGEEEGLASDLSISLAEIDEYDHDGGGLYCEKCSATIVESDPSIYCPLCGEEFCLIVSKGDTCKTHGSRELWDVREHHDHESDGCTLSLDENDEVIENWEPGTKAERV